MTEKAIADSVTEQSALHPRLALDEAIHQPVRLSIMATLAHATRVDFAFLRDNLGLGESNLSRHLSALEGLGYVDVDKVFEGKRGRTWLSITDAGRTAFDNHVRTLKEIVQGSFEAITPDKR